MAAPFAISPVNPANVAQPMPAMIALRNTAGNLSAAAAGQNSRPLRYRTDSSLAELVMRSVRSERPGERVHSASGDGPGLAGEFFSTGRYPGHTDRTCTKPDSAGQHIFRTGWVCGSPRADSGAYQPRWLAGCSRYRSVLLNTAEVERAVDLRQLPSTLCAVRGRSTAEQRALKRAPDESRACRPETDGLTPPQR